MDNSTMTPPSDNAAMPGPANNDLPNDPSPNLLAKNKAAADAAMKADANNN